MQDIQSAISEASRILAASSDSPELDAEILLCLILEKNRSYLRSWPKKQLHAQQRLQFKALLKQRQHGTPIAYMTGQREFWSREFRVSPDVLIPRPDTELLIELSLPLIPKDKSCKVIDLGTGSGVIAVTLATERPYAQLIATDLSSAALKIAKQNAEHYHCRNIRFLQSNWFSEVSENSFDVVISNPPYIAADDPHLHEGDLRFEPQSALIADDHGLKDISLIAESACKHLKEGGYLLIEHGYNQQPQVQAIFESFDYANIATHTDLAGNPRVTAGQWHP
jgi:release factor glutamine methyltransferase